MSEDRTHMIEIGDPEDEPNVPGVAPEAQVVIEYRDRGLPWMLVLPLLVTAAAVAIIGFKAFDDRIGPARPVALAPAPEPSPAPEPTPVAESSPAPPSVALGGTGGEPPGGPVLPPPSPLALPLASLPPEAEIPADPPATLPPAVVEASPLAEPPAVPPAEEARPFPQVAGLGFDPDALNRPEPKPEASDDVRPAGHPAEEPAPAQPAVAAEPEQPRTVDPRVLPLDPRQAERERYLRWVESRKQLDDDRIRFHADLRAILKRFGANAAPQIADICRHYGTEPDPIAKVAATRMLTVAAAGADPKVRINLLRKCGFPEASILLDIVENRARWEDGKSRNGPRTKDDILRTAALILLKCPPAKGATTARPTAATPSARPAGSFR